jgi:dTDP-4-dehydrorhamnose reductase
VYSPRATNFFQIILRKARANEPMRMVDDQTSVPTPSTFVAAHTVALLQEQLEGVFHVVPSGQATRFDFARAVVQAAGSASRVERARTSEFPAAARRPTYSVMANGKMARALHRALPDWRRLLAQEFESA